MEINGIDIFWNCPKGVDVQNLAKSIFLKHWPDLVIEEYEIVDDPDNITIYENDSYRILWDNWEDEENSPPDNSMVQIYWDQQESCQTITLVTDTLDEEMQRIVGDFQRECLNLWHRSSA